MVWKVGGEGGEGTLIPFEGELGKGMYVSIPSRRRARKRGLETGPGFRSKKATPETAKNEKRRCPREKKRIPPLRRAGKNLRGGQSVQVPAAI